MAALQGIVGGALMPLGIIALILLGLYYKETVNKVKQVIDWAGVALLTATILSLMFALELGGSGKYAWGSVEIVSLLPAVSCS